MIAVSFARRFARQLAHPHGAAGRLLGFAMDLANHKPTQLALDLLNPQAGERILDAGCGTGKALKAVLRRADCPVTGIDPSPAMIAAASRTLGQRATLVQTGMEGLPFPDASFDAVIALNVLYFADREGRMLANLHRVLKPGGRLVAYVTHRETMQDWPFARAGLHRLYDEAELVVALADGGFAPARISVHGTPITRSVKGLLAFAEH